MGQALPPVHVFKVVETGNPFLPQITPLVDNRVMPLRITHVDAFSSKPFGGNPAAVCVLPKAHDEEWMAQVAMEMNLSETAFLHAESDGYRLRWFTPSVEVALCGHATLASAHVLWEDGHLKSGAAAPMARVLLIALLPRHGRAGNPRGSGLGPPRVWAGTVPAQRSRALQSGRS